MIVGATEYRLEAVLGVALAGGGEQSPWALVDEAATALAGARDEGRPWRHFEPSMEGQWRWRDPRLGREAAP